MVRESYLYDKVDTELYKTGGCGDNDAEVGIPASTDIEPSKRADGICIYNEQYSTDYANCQAWWPRQVVTMRPAPRSWWAFLLSADLREALGNKSAFMFSDPRMKEPSAYHWTPNASPTPLRLFRATRAIHRWMPNVFHR